MPTIRTNFTISTSNHDWIAGLAKETGEKAMSRVLDSILHDHRQNGPLIDRMQLQADRLEHLAITLSPYTLQQIIRKGLTIRNLEAELEEQDHGH